jgi:hypothetical protein
MTMMPKMGGGSAPHSSRRVFWRRRVWITAGGPSRCRLSQSEPSGHSGGRSRMRASGAGRSRGSPFQSIRRINRYPLRSRDKDAPPRLRSIQDAISGGQIFIPHQTHLTERFVNPTLSSRYERLRSTCRRHRRAGSPHTGRWRFQSCRCRRGFGRRPGCRGCGRPNSRCLRLCPQNLGIAARDRA